MNLETENRNSLHEDTICELYYERNEVEVTVKRKFYYLLKYWVLVRYATLNNPTNACIKYWQSKLISVMWCIGEMNLYYLSIKMIKTIIGKTYFKKIKSQKESFKKEINWLCKTEKIVLDVEDYETAFKKEFPVIVDIMSNGNYDMISDYVCEFAGGKFETFKTKQYERVFNRADYLLKVNEYDAQIFFHCSYFLVFDMPEAENHWKQDAYSFVKKIKAMEVKSGDKAEYTEIALVEWDHGKHFCDDFKEPIQTLKQVYNSESKPHSFDFDMENPHNLEIYFSALDKFYYEFLIPWIAVSDKESSREELYRAIDKYLIAKRKEMI